MKRNYKLFVILIIGIVTSSALVQITQIPAASIEQYTYKIEKARLDAVRNGETQKTKEFAFTTNHSYTENTMVEVTLDSPDFSGCNGIYSINQIYFNYAYSTSLFKLRLEKEVSHIFHLSAQLTNLWEVVSYRDGISFIIWPYMYPDSSTWEFFDWLGSAKNAYYEQLEQQGHALQFKWATYEKGDIFFFEAWTGGEYTGIYGDLFDEISNNHVDISFDCLFKIAINQDTGIIHGLWKKGRVNGDFDDNNMSLAYEYLYETKGYNTPRFNFGPYFIVEPYLKRRIGISIGFLCTVVGSTWITLYLIKRKKK